MIAGPTCPGVGIPVYQPAGKPLGGTCMVPSAFKPRSISLESTPIAAICRRTGTDLGRFAAPTTTGEGGGGGLFGGEADDLTRVGVAAGGAPVTTVWAEQPAAPTTINASSAATPAVALKGDGRGSRFSLWCRKLAGFLRCSDDADVRQ